MDLLKPLSKFMRRRRALAISHDFLKDSGCTPLTNLPSNALAALRPVATEHKLKRFGGNADGGYLVPDDLSDIAACFSPGVDVVSDFEYTMAERGMSVFMADASVDGPAKTHVNFDFEKKFLGAEKSGDFITLSDWMNAKAPTVGDLLLQMDIEGAEWEVLSTLPDNQLQRFRIIVLELHGLHKIALDGVAEPIASVLEKLGEQFYCAHVHLNNCAPTYTFADLEFPDVIEATFIRKDRVNSVNPASALPHELDRPCCPKLSDRIMPPIWDYAD